MLFSNSFHMHCVNNLDICFWLTLADRQMSDNNLDIDSVKYVLFDGMIEFRLKIMQIGCPAHKCVQKLCMAFHSKS